MAEGRSGQRSALVRRALGAAAAVAICAAIVPAGTALAAAPTNDVIAHAIALVDGVQVVASNVDATKESGEHSFFFVDPNPSSATFGCNGGASVWYSVPADVGALLLTITASSYDAVVGLWTATTPAPAVSDLNGTGYSRRIGAGQTAWIPATLLGPGNYYFVSVDSCNSDSKTPPTSEGSLTFTPKLIPRPPNDPIAGALPLTAGTTTASNFGASHESNEHSIFFADPDPNAAIHSCSGAASTWYALPAGSTRLDLHVTASNYDSVLAVWSATTPHPTVADVQSLSLALRPGNGTLNPTQTDIHTALPGGSYYFLQVDDCNADSRVIPYSEGSISFTASFTPAVPPGYTGPSAPASPVHHAGVTSSGYSTVNVATLGLAGATKGLQASKKGSKITIKFVGKGIALHLVGYKKGGIVAVALDGAVPKKADLYRGTKPKDVTVVLKGLKPGKHTVTIVATGKRNARSLGASVILWLLSIGA